MSWTFSNGWDAAGALDWLTAHLDRFRTSTFGMELLARTQGERLDELHEPERRILDLLDRGPRCLDEMAQQLGATTRQFLPLGRLEQRHLIQRTGLTPTDLLHATGRLDLWNAEARAGIVGCSAGWRASRRISLRRSCMKDRSSVGDGVGEEATCRSSGRRRTDRGGRIIAELVGWRQRRLSGASCVAISDHRDRVAGASFLPDAARMLETQAVIPPHADVANAIGAITSQVSVQMKLEVSPREDGRYCVAGLSDAPSFGDFQEALDFALRELTQLVRQQACEAGTNEMRVTIDVHDHVAPAADGSIVFLGRDLTARLAGPPVIYRQCQRKDHRLIAAPSVIPS